MKTGQSDFLIYICVKPLAKNMKHEKVYQMINLHNLISDCYLINLTYTVTINGFACRLPVKILLYSFIKFE